MGPEAGFRAFTYGGATVTVVPVESEIFVVEFG
jgi:hypothetical protein